MLPQGLYRAITAVLINAPDDVCLVGGTALAGFYAGHRRSDDMDIFVGSRNAFRAMRLAIEALKKLGVTLGDAYATELFFHADAQWGEHGFTIDLVHDENLFQLYQPLRAADMPVASLDALMAMKTATLVSRCSEKDLFDLLWLFQRSPPKQWSTWIENGQAIDAGVNGETLIYSLTQAKLRKQGCGFAQDFGTSPAQVLRRIESLRQELIAALWDWMQDQAAPSLARTIEKIRKWDRE